MGCGFIRKQSIKKPLAQTAPGVIRSVLANVGKGKGEGDKLSLKASTDTRRERQAAVWLGVRLFFRKRKSSENHERLFNGGSEIGRALVNTNK